MTRRISLGQQIEELNYEIDQRRRVYPGLARAGKRRQSELDYHLERIEAARRTLAWLASHEVEIRAFMQLAPEQRAAALAERGGK